MTTVVLRNDTLELTFDTTNGTLIGLTAVRSGWPIISRPHLGLAFRLLVPLPRQRNNPVLGERQRLTTCEVGEEQRRARFVWDKVTSEHGGQLDICVELDVALTERQAIFTMSVDNQSPFPIENIFCPYLAEVAPPPQADWFKTFIYTYARADEWDLWPTFQNMRGYYGFDYPVQANMAMAVGTPMSPFFLLRSQDQGLYAGVNAPSAELVAWHTELHPGYGSSIDSRVPTESTISGHDVTTRFAAVHVPYIQPEEQRTLTPIALEAYQGGWQQGVDIYKRWRQTWMTPAVAPAWAQEPHAWQQIHINSPEDELRVPFRDLPRIGEECVRYGVRAIQLVGWNDGGQDQGNPSHDPDPRLGTIDELRAAIKQIQAMGVKVVLFTKFTWADRATERFRSDLIRQAIKDPYGDYYMHPGYQYQTATQMLDINTKRLIPMCFLSEEYLKVCEAEFQKVLDLGADGMLFDECLHHGPALLCFDPQHGHRLGAPVYANDRLLIQRLREHSDRVNPQFLMAGEACYDWELEAYSLSYHRSESKTHIPLSRYMLPETQLMTAITGFNDRNMINQCLMYRYVVSYEPFNFKGHLQDMPLTVAYGQQMDALRAELRAYFWDGEFRHEVGAHVTRGDEEHHPYAVFVRRDTGQTGVVVANYDEQDAITIQITLDSGKGLKQYRLVDDSTWQSPKDSVVIPPCSAAVVIE